MTKPLSPCPFCGGAPKSGWQGCGTPGMEDCGYWGIDCCNAFAHADSEDEAAEQWNRRAPLAAVEQAPCDMGPICLGCEPRNADGSCPAQPAPQGQEANEGADLYAAMMDACDRLPKWWMINFTVEKNAGWIELCDGDGNSIGVDTFGSADSTLAEQVSEALAFALENDCPSEAALKTGEQP